MSRVWTGRLAGLLTVLALHGLLLWGLWRQAVIQMPQGGAPLFVAFFAPPGPQPGAKPVQAPAPPRQPPRLLRVEQPEADSPAVTPPRIQAPAMASPVEAPLAAPVAPAPPGPPVQESPAPAPPLPAGPLELAAELAVACPERPPPAYPAPSRQSGETGTVVLRVELDETGHIGAIQVQSSSGYRRLDQAALDAVRRWRCTPAQRQGQPVRAIALQPFKFTLRGR